jgi:hypothetical protein
MRARAQAALVAACALALAATPAAASGAPITEDVWSSSVLSASARLSARIDPNGSFTTYHFEYLTQAKYLANGEGFAGASRAPLASDASVGNGSPLTVSQLLSGLASETTYRYRVVTNPASVPADTAHSFTTQGPAGPLLADGRGWEMVSPIDKNGGEVAAAGQIAAGGVLQAAAQGDAVTYGSRASFEDAQGAPPASQYLAMRTGSGWETENVSPAPLFSGTYDTEDGGVPYQLFSGDLTRALLLNGDRCRGGGSGCAVANPPLAGTDAPEGYQDYYLRDNADGSFTALLGATDAGFLALDPAHFDLAFAGSDPNLAHPVLSTCAALTQDATEVPLGEGCDPAKPNLYEWSGSGLGLVNLLPGETTGTPGAALGAQAGAISEDGSRVYFTDEGNLYLREGAQTRWVDEAQGGGGSFETASADGGIAFFAKAGHLYRYTAGGSAADLTPGGGVVGVLGASSSGDTVYYQDATGLQRWQSGVTAEVASGPEAAEEGDWPPATGAARVSADGTKLLFLSKEALTGYDNTDLVSGDPDPELYLYDGSLRCVSCNPTGERPLGPSSIPGAIANGSAPGSTRAYKPRVLSADGKRVFFDSADTLAPADTNVDHTTGQGIADVYQWEAPGEGSCAKPGGCVSLISSGRDGSPSTFVDASADGADAFFLAAASLVPSDPGARDLYDARVGGGFPEPSPPIPCKGDACQALPPEPGEPTLTTLLSGSGNPAVRYVKHCRAGTVKRKGHCVRRHRHKPHGRPR